jgi:hypothetical protein
VIWRLGLLFALGLEIAWGQVAAPEPDLDQIVTVELSPLDTTLPGEMPELRSLEGRVVRKDPYELVLEQVTSGGGFMRERFPGRHVISIDGVPFAEFPITGLRAPHVLLVISEDGGEEVIEGEVESTVQGLRVRPPEGALPRRYPWSRARGVDGQELDVWLGAQGWGAAGDLTDPGPLAVSPWQLVQRPASVLVAPRLHRTCRRLWLVWSEDPFVTAVLVLLTLTLAVLAGAILVRLLALGTTRKRPRSLGRAFLAGLLAAVTVVLGYAATTWLAQRFSFFEGSGQIWMAGLTLVAAYLVHLGVCGYRFLLSLVGFVLAGGAGVAVLYAMARWGLPEALRILG